jgi:predicted aldo/keto reductase-like oxidoreductase
MRMKYRNMGRITKEVSALGFGAMRMPANKHEAADLIRYAIDNGINYVDTAFTYHAGRSEVIVGRALLDGYRERVTLTTKSPLWLIKTREDFDKCLKKQIKRLKTNPDVYLFHGMNKDRLEKVKKLNLIDKMEEAKAEGKFKFIGFSFHDGFDAFKEIVDFYDWDCCQIQHNYLDVDYQAGTKGLKYAASKNIPVIIMEPIRGGQLVIPEENLESRPEIKKVLDNSKIKRTLPDWALQFLWNQPEISVVLSGMSNTQQVTENIESANNSGINMLTKEELQTISGLREAFKKFYAVPCTNCGYCMPCPNGVSIPTINRILNDAVYYGTRDNPITLYFYSNLAKTPEELEQKIANGEETVGAQTLCIKCGECVDKCPQQIDIPNMMEKANLIFEEGKDVSEVL